MGVIRYRHSDPLPAGYLECGKAWVPQTADKKGWAVPGGGVITDKRAAQKMCERIDAMIHGEVPCSVRIVGGAQ